jgi:ribosome recycling factor
MSEKTPPEGDLREEFHNLGRNLKDIINTAWESDERKKVQADIQDGLDELGNAINEMVEEFKISETGKKVVKEVDDFGERLRSGEVRDQAHEGILAALKKMNAELEKTTDKFTTSED